MPFTTLVVDDDSAVLSTLKSVLETRDMEVFTAVSASDALSQMAARSFDLVVTDMRMETDVSGFDVVRGAKALSNHPVTVILSAFPIPTEEWRQAGADAAFVKGGGIFRILDDIERLLHEHSGQRPANH
jgi:CheY-like chemotaxis protein